MERGGEKVWGDRYRVEKWRTGGDKEKVEDVNHDDREVEIGKRKRLEKIWKKILKRKISIKIVY